MSRIHGKGGVVYLSAGNTAAQLLSQAAEYDISADFDTVNVPVLGDTWDTMLQGLRKWSGTISGPFDSTQTLAWDAMSAANPSNLYIYPQASVPTAYYYGTVWPKLNIKGGVGGAVSFSSAFTGTGTLGKN